MEQITFSQENQKSEKQEVDFRMPTGVYYKESEWGNSVENHQEDIQNAYTEILEWINSSTRAIVNDYSQKNPNQVSWNDDSQDFFESGGVEVIDNESQKALRLWAEGGKLEYLVQKQQEKYYASLKNFSGFIVPEELQQSIKSDLIKMTQHIEEKINQLGL